MYLCKRLPGALNELIRARGFDVEQLEADADELESIASAVAQFEPLLVVLDHYGIDARVEARLRAACHVPLMCYDDTFEAHDCDFVVNQNAYASAERYAGKLPPAAVVLAGLEYAALRPEFRLAKRPRGSANDPPRLLVTLGGSDPGNATSEVLEALRSYAGPVEVKAVVGSGNPHGDSVCRAARRLQACEVLCDVRDMGALMAEADVAVIGAGQTTLEALFMELPTVSLVIAENQRLNAEHLSSCGLSVSMPREFEPAALCQAISELVDGKGVDRVALANAASRVGSRSVVEAVERLRFARFSIRRTAAEDILPLFDLANDPDVRANSGSVAPIVWEEHSAWFARATQEATLQLLTLVDGCGQFMGQLRFDCSEAGRAVMSVSIVERARGLGLGTAIIQRAVARLLAAEPQRTVEAVVKNANVASLRSFSRAGFKRVRQDAESVVLHLNETDYAND